MFFEASRFPSALLILSFPGTSFPIQGNRVGVMNSCGVQTMSPLWPPVCKWNSQQSTGQEVTLLYSFGTLLCREHSVRFSSPSSLNETLQPLFFFFYRSMNPAQFVLIFLGNVIVRQSTKDVDIHSLLSSIPYEQTKDNKARLHWAQRMTVV